MEYLQEIIRVNNERLSEVSWDITYVFVYHLMLVQSLFTARGVHTVNQQQQHIYVKLSPRAMYSMLS